MTPAIPALPVGRLLMGLSLGTDLARDVPMESALRTCLFSLEIAATLGAPVDLRAVFHVALLRFLGCTAYSHELTHALGVDDRAVHHLALLQALEGKTRGVLSEAAVQRVVGGLRPIAAAMADPAARRGMAASQCEVAAHLADRLGLGPTVCAPLRQAYERWNGAGVPDGLAEDAIEPVARIVQGGYLTELAVRAFSPDDVVAVLRGAAGEALDPRVAEAAIDALPTLTAWARQPSIWDELAARVPDDGLPLDGLGPLAAAFADFADLKSVYRIGHSSAVAARAEAAAAQLGLGVDAREVRVAGLLHDLGLVSVSTATLDKPGPLSNTELERLRLHPYHTVRVLAPIPQLRAVTAIAGGHHERLDGTGYPMATTALSVGARLLAAADVYTALREDRAHRPALSAREARRVVEGLARDGQLDAGAVAAVLAVDGVTPAVRGPRPALTPRQLEVLRLIALGRTEKEVAQALALSPRTVHHHVTHIYERLGVSTRVAVALFAVENGLLQRPS
ncbi:MAG: HD domain-containing phosphohydrolase [Myxococcota bacterium]